MTDSPSDEFASSVSQPVFRDAVLKKQDFSDCRLAGAVFQNCDLTDAHFDGAHLDRATFSGCTLIGASLCRASLRGASFRDCSGLTLKQFAGAQLEGAVLPDFVAKPSSLARLSEISKRAYTLLGLIVGACLTSALVISNTSDVSLLANRGSLPLPGTAIKVPAATFFVTMPCIIAALWIFLQLTLLHLWQDFADLPAVFTDGEARYRKADLWLLGSYVWSLSEDADHAKAEWLKLLVFHILIWLLVPLVLVSFWVSYLRRHDIIGTNIQIAAICMSGLFGAYLAMNSRSALRGQSKARPSKRYAFTIRAIIAIVIVLLFLSNAAINGVHDFDSPPFLGDHDASFRRIGQLILKHLPIRTQSTLREVTLGDDQKELDDADIKYGDAAHLIAPSANLRKAVLQESPFPTPS